MSSWSFYEPLLYLRSCSHDDTGCCYCDRLTLEQDHYGNSRNQNLPKLKCNFITFSWIILKCCQHEIWQMWGLIVWWTFLPFWGSLHHKSEPLLDVQQQLSQITWLHDFSILSGQQIFLSSLVFTSVPWTHRKNKPKIKKQKKKTKQGGKPIISIYSLGYFHAVKKVR